MGFKTVDVFIEDHGRRLHFLAPALLFAPPGAGFVLGIRLIIRGGDQFRWSEHNSSGGDGRIRVDLGTQNWGWCRSRWDRYGGCARGQPRGSLFRLCLCPTDGCEGERSRPA